MLSWLVYYLIDGMTWLVCALIGGFLYWTLWILKSLFDLLPDDWTQRLGTGWQEGWKYWGWADQFFPLNLTAGLMFTYFIWLLACRLMAWAMKMLRG